MGLYSDNNPVQLSRMELTIGKRNKIIAPLNERGIGDTVRGTPRSQPVPSRQRATGTSSGTRGANSRLENTGQESKLVDIEKRTVLSRRRRVRPNFTIRTPQLQRFTEGERPDLNKL